jgi:hypothetical protein
MEREWRLPHMFELGRFAESGKLNKDFVNIRANAFVLRQQTKIGV